MKPKRKKTSFLCIICALLLAATACEQETTPSETSFVSADAPAATDPLVTDFPETKPDSEPGLSSEEATETEIDVPPETDTPDEIGKVVNELNEIEYEMTAAEAATGKEVTVSFPSNRAKVGA